MVSPIERDLTYTLSSRSSSTIYPPTHPPLPTVRLVLRELEEASHGWQHHEGPAHAHQGSKHSCRQTLWVRWVGGWVSWNEVLDDRWVGGWVGG